MKGYFNNAEKVHQLLITMARTEAEDLIKSNCCTIEEIKCLKKVIEYVSKFNNLVFERLGSGYAKSLVNLSRDNTIKLCSRDNKAKYDMSTTLDDTELHKLVDELGDIECGGCTMTNQLNCPMYKMKSHFGYQGINDDTNLCPFRQEIKKYDLDLDL